MDNGQWKKSEKTAGKQHKSTAKLKTTNAASKIISIYQRYFGGNVFILVFFRTKYILLLYIIFIEVFVLCLQQLEKSKKPFIFHSLKKKTYQN